MTSPTARPAAAASLPARKRITEGEASKLRAAAKPGSATVTGFRTTCRPTLAKKSSRRIRKELALLRKILIHPLENLAQRSTPLTGLAHREVERNSQQLSLVVVGNTPLWLSVVRIFFKPRVQTRFLRRLCQMGGPALEFRELLSQPEQVTALIQKPGAEQDNAFNGAVYALGEP